MTCCLITPAWASEARDVVVEVDQGTLVGAAEAGVRRFLAIPYAAPPLGALRFRAPQIPAAWVGRRAARQFAPVCPQLQFDAGATRLIGDEDCLYLNVYTPDTQMQDQPVLVWIHGGGRRIGDGRRDVTSFVRETGSIVVTIQYRLDRLAFLAHPALSREDASRLSSGNYGFLDAIAALRWIRDEISAFGGDPNRVTIGGLSGGGTMVCGLLLSPQSRGLFHAAIVQSGGGCWFPTDSIERAEARGRRDAEQIGCESSGDVAACLRTRPVESFFENGTAVDNPFAQGSTEFFAAQPILGGSTGHFVDGHVFPRDWPRAFQIGAFHHVPLLIGVTQHEGRRVYAELLSELGGHAFAEDDYLLALHGLTGSRELGEAAARRFPLDRGGRSPAEVFADVGTEAHYTCPHAELAQATARFAPTWLYQFRIPGSRENEHVELGAYHGADTELLFGGGFRGPIPPLDPPQRRAAETLRGYVARFIRTGDPNGTGLPSWPVHDERAGTRHLEFDTSPQAQTGLRERACEFWREAEWALLPGIR